MSKTIRIDRDVARWIAERAQPGESPNAVIRRVLGLAPNQMRSGGIGSRSPSGPKVDERG